MAISKIIVVGAGPSGLLLTLLLARAGMPVDLVEMTTALDTNPRATHYPEASCYELDRAGVLDEVRAAGFTPTGVSWRKLDAAKTRLAQLANPPAPPGQEDAPEHRHRMVCLPLHRLGKILEAHVKAQPAARIRYNHAVTGLGQDADGAWVVVQTPEGEQTLRADYVVGCDGGNSKVRRLLFGEGREDFPGHTWEEIVVATNVYYDLSPYDYDDSQFFVHPQHWHMVAKIQSDGLQRISYGEIGGLSTEELRERLPWKFREMLPGHPEPDQYEVVNFSPYKVHQRCVDKMRVGRVLLAADAAHLCNPFGGQGLTGGIADVGSLYDSFVGIHTGKADDSILDKYDEIRRKIWHDIINLISSDNMRRLIDLDPDEALEKDPTLKALRRMQDSGAAPKPIGYRPGVGPMDLGHDMTQYYKQE